MESSKGKLCPMNSSASFLAAALCNARDHSAHDEAVSLLQESAKCTGTECAWWCGFAQDCAVPLLAGMFADSEICRTKFGGENNA